MYIYNTSLKAFNAEVLWITGFFFIFCPMSPQGRFKVSFTGTENKKGP